MIGKILNFFDKIFTFFEEWTLFITVMVALIALFFNVICRYGFNYSLAWSEELIREVIIYTTFIGCSAAIKNRSMIRIDALVQLVPRVKFPLAMFSNFMVLAFCRNDDLLRNRDVSHAGRNKPEIGNYADPFGLSLCDSCH